MKGHQSCIEGPPTQGNERPAEYRGDGRTFIEVFDLIADIFNGVNEIHNTDEASGSHVPS